MERDVFCAVEIQSILHFAGGNCMYKKNKKDLEKVFEVIERHRANTSQYGRWEYITKELNSYFTVTLTSKQWKTQYELGKKRLQKHGNPAILLPRTELKEIITTKKDKEKELDILQQKLKNLLIKPITTESIMNKLKIDIIKTLGLIQMLKRDNYIILYNEYDETYVIDKKPVPTSKIYKHHIGEVSEFEFVVISDTHWGSKHQQKSFVDFIYKEAYERNIKNVYHAGDIVDGFYKGRPEHIYELFVIGADEQTDYVVNNWPKYEGITTHLLLGNHDETHIKNGGFDIGKSIATRRKDFEYLGIGHAIIELTPNCRMDLFHPLDGSSYAVSYSGQKYMDSLSGGDKPNIMFTGHHHKVLYFPYRNIHYFEAPSMTQQSSWMKRKRMANESGAWFIKIKVDEEGTIVSVLPELIKQYKFLKNDY